MATLTDTELLAASAADAPRVTLRAEILAKVEQLRSVARFLRNDPIVSEDQDEIELFINNDDAMECDAIADRLLGRQ